MGNASCKVHEYKIESEIKNEIKRMSHVKPPDRTSLQEFIDISDKFPYLKPYEKRQETEERGPSVFPVEENRMKAFLKVKY